MTIPLTEAHQTSKE